MLFTERTLTDARGIIFGRAESICDEEKSCVRCKYFIKGKNDRKCRLAVAIDILDETIAEYHDTEMLYKKSKRRKR